LGLEKIVVEELSFPSDESQYPLLTLKGETSYGSNSTNGDGLIWDISMNAR